VGFVVEKLELGQVSFRVIRFSPVSSLSFHHCYTLLLYLSISEATKSRQFTHHPVIPSLSFTKYFNFVSANLLYALLYFISHVFIKPNTVSHNGLSIVITLLTP